VARQWSTAVRYRADVARQKGFFAEAAPLPTWTEKQLADIETERMAWIRSRAGAEGPTLEALEVGQKLPTRPMGPTRCPAWLPSGVPIPSPSGARAPTKDPITSRRAGLAPRDGPRSRRGQGRPRLGDGLYHGPSRGHTDEEHAKLIGMPRGYGYGASMGAWVLDYVAAWAGDSGYVRHSNIQYRFPAFDGDLTLLDAEVTDARHDPMLGAALVTLEVTMTKPGRLHHGQGPVTVELPS